MTISHHPGEELLLGYASGADNEAVALLVATHISLCAQCRAVVRSAEAAGGSVLAQLPPVPLAQSAYQSVLARLDEPAADIVRRADLEGAGPRGDVPGPLRPYIGADFSALRWRRVAPGISHYPLIAKDGMRARLIRTTPGAGVATHSHLGEEWTLVLTGSFHDDTGRYQVGDVQSTTSEIEHEPTADPGPVCINLAVTSGPLVFRGLLPKIVGKIFGF